MDITAIVNMHREGEIAKPSILSARKSVQAARSAGFTAELILVLDRPDEATRNVVESNAAEGDFRVIEVENGDLGLSRNSGVAQARGDYVGFLDGDDLWCVDWLAASCSFSKSNGANTICHPAWNVIFGTKRLLFPHPDQTDRKLSMDSFRVANYWTALSFARRDTYEAFPYRPNRLSEGFGYEDWAWNWETIRHGFLHRVVPDTSHFIRYKKGDSLRQATNAQQCLRTPYDLNNSKVDSSLVAPH